MRRPCFPAWLVLLTAAQGGPAVAEQPRPTAADHLADGAAITLTVREPDQLVAGVDAPCRTDIDGDDDVDSVDLAAMLAQWGKCP